MKSRTKDDVVVSGFLLRLNPLVLALRPEGWAQVGRANRSLDWVGA